MNTSVKVRLLLLVLCISFFVTALIVTKTSDSANLLSSSALTLQKNLNDRETYVQDFLKKPASIPNLQRISRDEKEALQLIQTFVKNNKIYFCTYKNNQLDFWSSSRIAPDSSLAYPAGTSFSQEKNGYYEVIKKVQGNFSVLFFIPIKAAYSFKNQYLNNNFSNQLLDNDYLDIAETPQAQTHAIVSSHKQPLFYVKLKPGYHKNYFASLEIVLWSLSVLVLFILVYNLCTYVANSGHVKSAVLLAALFVVLAVAANFLLHRLGYVSETKALPAIRLNCIYGEFFSITDIALIILFVSWLSIFLYSNRFRLIRQNIGSVGSCLLLLLMLFLLAGLSVVFSSLFFELTIDSRIQFDIDNLLSLTAYNLLGTVMLCLSYLIFFLLAETCIIVSTRLSVSNSAKLLISILLIIVISIIHYYITQYFTLFYLLWAVILIWRAYNVYQQDGKIPAVAFVLILALSSVIATIQLLHIQKKLDTANRASMVRSLTHNSDANAEVIFRQIEAVIDTDRILVRYFSNPQSNFVYLKNHIHRLYFDDYLANYDFKMYAYNCRHNIISGQQGYDLNVFQNQVLFGSLQVKGTKFFYRITDAFETRRYFAIIPVKKAQELIGVIVVDLNSKSLESSTSFPQLLANENLQQQNDFKKYSYAFYSDGKLISQNGKYEYSLTNKQFRDKRQNYTTEDGGYSHSVYQLNQRKLIVVSTEDKAFVEKLSIFIFFFVIFLFFTLLATAVYWVWSRMKDLNFNHFIWSLQVAANNLLYKTRIQISMVTSVVFTLLIIGVVTYITFSRQDKQQQDDLNHERIKQIAADYEREFAELKNISQEDRELRFSTFAATYGVDLILYDTTGVPKLYTQPKLYTTGLISRRMNATAFIEMQLLQKSELLNDEEIGKFKYRSAYVPIHDNNYDTVNFLQLPYFANEAEYNARIGYFVNSMLNVYALVLVAIGLFAIFIAKKITNPLNLIQQGLANTMYGRKTEPINWKRNDEIGSLIKEYNKMIASLELSAQKLAKSERENAWREMAKQIAHEIKNPLTPLKLGLQLLSKSWKDKDPKFDVKFQKFSTSFIEQIETLSRIATEFSDFAKLPDAKPEVVNIFDVISRATNIFGQTENLRMDFTPRKEFYLIRADKDQLMRCFNNLLKNAIEAMPENHKGVISITYQTTEENIEIRVQDNGNGIPENLRSNIFQPNFTTKSSGTGLGLAFIKNAIENAGGKVWFDSETGTGTTFYLLFPSASKNFV